MIPISYGSDGRAAGAIPQVNLELRLFRFLVVTIADEGQSRLIFIPGQLLILAFAGQQRERGRVRLSRHCINSIGLFIPRSHGVNQRLRILAQVVVEHIGEGALGARDRVSQDQIGSVFFARTAAARGASRCA